MLDSGDRGGSRTRLGARIRCLAVVHTGAKCAVEEQPGNHDENQRH
jgi:hypothetical protein